MPELSHIDPRSAALLVTDYQVDTLTRFMTAAQLGSAADVHHPGNAPGPISGSPSRLGRAGRLLRPPGPDCPGDRDLLVRSFCATCRNGNLGEGGNAAEPDVVDPSPGLGDCGEQSVPAFGPHCRAHLQSPTPCGFVDETWMANGAMLRRVDRPSINSSSVSRR
jgi:hypothetical protein